jgi:hypothetical protein
MVSHVVIEVVGGGGGERVALERTKGDLLVPPPRWHEEGLARVEGDLESACSVQAREGGRRAVAALAALASVHSVAHKVDLPNREHRAREHTAREPIQTVSGAIEHTHVLSSDAGGRLAHLHTPIHLMVHGERVQLARLRPASASTLWFSAASAA